MIFVNWNEINLQSSNIAQHRQVVVVNRNEEIQHRSSVHAHEMRRRRIDKKLAGPTVIK